MSGLLTIGSCLEEGASLLAEAGIESARPEARLILARALGVELVTVMGYPEYPVDVEDAAVFHALIRRRSAREPLSHLTGRREFWSLEFEVTPATLDPRPDSESIVEAALASVRDKNAPLTILDFGAGTGCLLLALLSELPGAIGLGVDVAEGAAAVSRRNADRLGLRDRAFFAVGDWGGAVIGAFDLIVSNPPYIPVEDIALLEPEVARFEPRRALDGGCDGLDAYRRLAPDIARLLRVGGAAVLEFGPGQCDSVAHLMQAQGLALQGIRTDLAGRRRCVTVTKR